MQRARKTAVCLLLISLVFSSSFMEAKNMGTLKLSSPQFKHHDYLPARFTCDGADVNPPLQIENVPSGTRSLALIVDDPDAPRGTWVHWVVWNIGPDIKEIKEHAVPSGASEGTNDFRTRSYGGPCPPSGAHRYFFKLYALDVTLALAPNTTKADLERAMKGHILAQSELVGLYRRK
jgi:Raf kinase inhibitor-like YbhB/YbcL family protein